MDERVHLRLDRSAASAVDAYFEYRSIVGDDDNGKLFTPEEYEAYKKKVLPNRIKNRIYVSWTNQSGMDCKLIGPETQCFCQHRYKQHKTDFEGSVSNNSELKCKVIGCGCSGYHYIPKNGNLNIKCHCKHESSQHIARDPNKCKKCPCPGFQTSYRCGCGSLVAEHSMIVETRDERLKRGHPVSKYETPYAAMGGLTGMSSLMDGYLRLDDSGIGAPSKEFLEGNSSSTNTRSDFGRIQPPRGNRIPISSKPTTSKKKTKAKPEWVDDF